MKKMEKDMGDRKNITKNLRLEVRKVKRQIRNLRAYRKRSRKVSELLKQYQLKVSPAADVKNIIFIVVDCLRKDHVSLYGYQRSTTPFLNSLVKKAAVFENAITAAPWTYPAVASLLTGLYPHNHGGVFSQNLRHFGKMLPEKVNPNVITLPELLCSQSFDTFLSSAIETVELVNNGWFRKVSIFHTGAEQHIDEVIKWVRKNRSKNFFLYCQLGDLHMPINAPEPYRSIFGKIPKIPKLDRFGYCKEIVPETRGFEEYMENGIKLYDSALRFVDSQIARLFDYLKRKNYLDSSMIVITADHGEEFWDHADIERKFFYHPLGLCGTTHGHNLFQEIINVPLLIIGPNVPAGRYRQNVSLVDVVPTALSFCGIKHNLNLDGVSLFNREKKRIIMSEEVSYGYEKKALFKDKWKFLYSEGDGVKLLFDLSEDPKERVNLAERNPELIKRFMKNVVCEEYVEKKEVLRVDKEVEKQLHNLGYM